MLLEAIIAHVFEVLLRDDPARPCGQGPVIGHKIGPRLVQMKAHPVGIDDLHLPDFLMQDVGFVAQEGKLDVLGGEGIAIVKR